MNKLLKIGLVLTIAIAMFVVGTGAAFAATTASVSEVTGTITAIDKVATPPTVTIAPEEGNAVVLKVDSSTVISKAGVGTITINGLAIHDKATANYSADTGIANKITVIQPEVKHNSFEGTIKSITGSTLVVTTKKGDETFNVSSDTVYKVPGVKDATLKNFKVGDKVSASTVDVTTSSTTVQMAQRLTLIPGKPVKIARTGTVTAYTPNSSITVQDKKGVTTTFIINSDTKISFKKGTTTIAIGDRVTVSASRSPDQSQFTAKSIRDFGVKQTNHNNNGKHNGQSNGNQNGNNGKHTGQNNNTQHGNSNKNK